MLLSSGIYAQNIVANPNFAIDTACPDEGGQISFCAHWIQPTLGTCDYFNACAPTGSPMTVPQNMAGYQSSYAHAYAGIFSYCGSAYVAPDYKEYIGTTIPPLEVGATYKVTILVSLADSAFYATDGLGVLFSMNPVGRITVTTIAATPQVDYSSYGVVTDKVNWVTLTANFIPDSAFTHITIGNFKPDSVVALSVCSYSGAVCAGNDSTAYYYIDSVSVEKILPPTKIAASNMGSTRACIYPNPAKDFAQLTFNYLEGDKDEFDLYNSNGHLIYRLNNISSGNVQIMRGDLPAGLYFYELHTNNQIAQRGKLLFAD